MRGGILNVGWGILRVGGKKMWGFGGGGGGRGCSVNGGVWRRVVRRGLGE